MSDQEPDESEIESEIAFWTEQGEPFSEDLVEIINKHRREVPLGAVFFSMAYVLAFYMEVQAKNPEESKACEVSARRLIDAGFKQARKYHANGTLDKMFPTVQ